jgi:endonuclease/exonuclease/phosphatase (EEP) superfamily protein YafD
MRSLLLDLLRLLVRGTALVLGLLGAIFALAGLVGVVSDKLDALNQVAPLWLGLGLVTLVLSRAFDRGGQRNVVCGLALATIIASGAQIAPELVAAIPSGGKVINGSQVKIVQFNLWESNKAPLETSRWILAQKADVVLVEEAGGMADPILKQLFKAYPYRASCRGRIWCDTWIFSRWPMTGQHGFYEDGADLSGVRATVISPGGRFTVAAAHFVWPVPAGHWQAQSRILVAQLRDAPKDDLVVGGDFNSAPWSFGLRRQDKALGVKRVTHGLRTWPSGAFTRVMNAPFPVLAIDQVYAGKAWKTIKVERGPVLGSDHRAVVVTLGRRAKR